MRYSFICVCITILLFGCHSEQPRITLSPQSRIALVGGNLCSRMMEYGHFEKELHIRFPDHQLYIRNMCDGGNTPGFRPHSSRETPWAFAGADSYYPDISDSEAPPEGFYEYPDEWLDRHDIDIILAFFGASESYDGPAGLDNFKNLLTAFVTHTLNQQYNDSSSPQLILVTPSAIEDISDRITEIDGIAHNEHLKLYSDAIHEVAAAHDLITIDAYRASLDIYEDVDDATIDGLQLTDAAYEQMSAYIADETFGGSPKKRNKAEVHAAVLDKNWHWKMDYKSPNGVHVHGRRYDPFGSDNYPYELEKLRHMTAIRDTAIWMAATGDRSIAEYIEQADIRTTALPEVITNYDAGYGHGEDRYLYGAEALQSLTTPAGYKMELFASEEDFPELANPVQMSFDNKGRLWVAVMPTYPHWKPGDPKPDDKLLIIEDTDGDGKADQVITWADGLHIPVGFELAPEGVYVSQGSDLVLLSDTDGDDRADRREIIFSGFDDHDTHHVISAFCADPSGAIYMGEGVFLRTDVETAYGTVRGTNGGFYRYDPRIHKLERVSQVPIPNPWGIAFDKWGQEFFAETSGPDVHWMLPGMNKPTYGLGSPKARNIIEDDHRVRPTSGLEFLHSRHFPDEVQGDLLIANCIGFLGMKQHEMSEDGTGYGSQHRQDLFVSDDKNFRPVDMEIAPDGSLYFLDWHNVLIGHMQHNARDPLRDHKHGRIYRVTYPARPLLSPADIADASIESLLDHLLLPEYRTRYRARRELRARNQGAVLAALDVWIKNLDTTSVDAGHHLLEALWVRQGLNAADSELLRQLLKHSDHRIRAAATKVVKFNRHEISDHIALLKQAARDEHGRVRMEALIAASWLPEGDAQDIIALIEQGEVDDWMKASLSFIKAQLDPDQRDTADSAVTTAPRTSAERGELIYHKEGYCVTCHMADGQGLSASGFPPLAGSEWVTGDPTTLVKLTLKGMIGPITVKGIQYEGHTPMTPYENLLSNQEIGDVLTFIRSSWGNDARPIPADLVMGTRRFVSDKKGFFKAEELLEAADK